MTRLVRFLCLSRAFWQHWPSKSKQNRSFLKSLKTNLPRILPYPLSLTPTSPFLSFPCRLEEKRNLYKPEKPFSFSSPSFVLGEGFFFFLPFSSFNHHLVSMAKGAKASKLLWRLLCLREENKGNKKYTSSLWWLEPWTAFRNRNLSASKRC